MSGLTGTGIVILSELLGGRCGGPEWKQSQPEDILVTQEPFNHNQPKNTVLEHSTQKTTLSKSTHLLQVQFDPMQFKP